MRYLLDTHILLWSAGYPEKLSTATNDLLVDPVHELYFSTVSIWETAIKHGRGYQDFQVDPAELRQGLFNANFRELPVFGEHAVAVAGLPIIHKDPFDRLLIAQAKVEGIILLTADAHIARYGGMIQRV
jgi:PIN domain nuclease of toxin-antitoxin system